MTKISIKISLLLLFVCQSAGAQQKVILPRGTDGTVVNHMAYTVSFNPSLRTPNYVSYLLRPEDITTEGVSRMGEEFLPDPDIPGCPESSEYTRSHYPSGYVGYQRGHMMPAADNKTSEERMRESFYLSNVCPQNGNLNEGPWCDLENQVRFWCKHYYKTSLWVVCGPIPGKDATTTGINIPSGFWKVVCRFDSKYGHWKAIGFIFDNDSSIQPYDRRAVSVDEVEALTGMDFFSEVEDSEEDYMEKNTGNWKF